MQNPIGQVRMNVWDFLAKVCMLPESGKYPKLQKSKICKDINGVLDNNKISQFLEQCIINDKEKDVRDAAAKFIFAAKRIGVNSRNLDKVYKNICEDKRACIAYESSGDMFNQNMRQLKGLFVLCTKMYK